jgi:hypothetical protein
MVKASNVITHDGTEAAKWINQKHRHHHHH